MRKEEEVHLPTIISKGNQLLISISSKDFSFIVEDNLSKIFDAFAGHKVKINLMQNSAISFSVCIDNDAKKIAQLIQTLENDYTIKINEGVELLTISNYSENGFSQFIKERKLLIEQKTRNTVQLVVN